MDKSRKLITFDLSTEKLREAGFSTKFPMAMKPYNAIGREMKALGFAHLQKSVYTSKEELTHENVLAAVKQLDQKLPWLADCTEKIHVANVSEEREFSLSDFLNRTKQVREKNEVTPAQEAPAAPARRSMEETRAAVAARKAATETPAHAPPTKSKTKGERGD